MSNPRESTLQTLLEGIEEVSGLRVSLYDLNYFSLDAASLDIPKPLRIHCSAYCLAVKNSPEAFRLCREVELGKAELAARAGEPVLHTCHAGVTDLVVPLMNGSRSVGALYFGQGVLAGTRFSPAKLAAFCREYGLDLATLREASEELPRFEAGTLERWQRLLNGVRHYIEQTMEFLLLTEERETTFFAAIQREEARARRAGAMLRAGAIRIEELPNRFLDTLHPPSEEIRNALALVRAGYWKELPQDDVARHVGLSQSQFSRRFRRETGVTFRSCLAQARVWAAGVLLKKTSYTLAAIAEALGYSSTSSLQRAFRIHEGSSLRSFARRLPPYYIHEPTTAIAPKGESAALGLF